MMGRLKKWLDHYFAMRIMGMPRDATPKNLPSGAKLGQALRYDHTTLFVYYLRRNVYIRDQTGDYPLCPVTRRRSPHPDEGTEYAYADYETLGLYYGLPMPETGWGSEGEF